MLEIPRKFHFFFEQVSLPTNFLHFSTFQENKTNQGFNMFSTGLQKEEKNVEKKRKTRTKYFV